MKESPFLKPKHRNNQYLYYFINLLKQFYVEDIILIMQANKRSVIHSIVLFTFKELLLIQLQIDDTTLKNITTSKNS